MSLQKMQKITKGWFAKIVIGIISAAFALVGIEHFLLKSPGEVVVASVNSEDISANELQKQMELERRALLAKYKINNITRQVETFLKAKALKSLIYQKVLEQDALQLGYSISEKQVNKFLMDLEVFQVDGKFNQSRFLSILGQQGQSVKSFLESMKLFILEKQARFSIVSSAFTYPGEVARYYELLEQKRDFALLDVKRSLFMDKVKVTDIAIKDYYKKHKKDFTTQEQVSISYLELSLDKLKEGIKVTDKEIKDYYDSHKASYKTKPKWQLGILLVKAPIASNEKEQKAFDKKINTIKKAIKDKKDFSALVAKYSDDKTTKDKGGDIGFSNLEELNHDIKHAVLDQKGKGVIKEPVKIDNGTVFVNIISIKDAIQKPLKDVKANVKDLLKTEEAQKDFASLSEKLADLTFSNPESLEVAASELKLSIQTTEIFTKLGTTKGITNNPKVIASSFSPEVLIDKQNSEVITLTPETQVVLRVKSHAPSIIPSFDKIKGIITSKLKETEALDKARRYGRLVIKRALENRDKDTSLMNGLAWKSYKGQKRDAKDLDPKVLNLAFSMNHKDPVKNIKGEVIANSFMVVKLKSIQKAKLKDLSQEKRQALVEDTTRTIGYREYQYYTKMLMDTAKIKR